MDNLQKEKNYGTLIVWAQSASEAIPIEGATVIVRLARENGESDLFRVLTTDESGLTVPIRIETPSPAESLSPGGKKPYSEISTEVTATGFYSVINTGIPIYPGITSIQPVRMIPIPTREDGTPFPSGTVIINEGQNLPNL
jgi:hypothetical protein